MHRRTFLRAGATTGVAAAAAAVFAAPLAAVPIALPRVASRRGLMCTPFDYNGLQQCEAGIDSNVLDVVASDTQHASEWCWAACIEAVFSYYGHPVAQERIVDEAYGDIVNMPGSPSQILQALNRTWTDEDADDFTARGTIVGVNPITAAQDLAADRPLIIGTLGHAMVLTALTYVRNAYGAGQVLAAEVRDPWPYNPRHRVLSPPEWYSISFAARIRVS